ncbi:STAS domain-containing protein [Cyclobacteriaceae bacterium]|nr:STAS domain-containing protein [Cyclobacteriaceae bacterium]
MTIKCSKEDKFCIVAINGDLDASSAVLLDNEVRSLINDDEKHIFIDCNELNYVASAGLGVFMSYIQDIKTKNINFRLFNLSEKILDVFKILGLDVLMTIDNTKEDVLNSISE